MYNEDLPNADFFDDDSNLPISTITNHCSGTLPPFKRVAETDNSLQSTALAESFDNPVEFGDNVEQEARPEEFGPGK